MKWSSELITHRGEKRISVEFEKDAGLIIRIKKLPGVKWSQTLKVLHLPDNAENRKRFEIKSDQVDFENNRVNTEISKFQHWLHSKRYSESTVKTYSDALKSFLIFFKNRQVNDLTNQDVIFYNNEFIRKRKLSASYQNQVVNAVKLYFSSIQSIKMETEKIHRPKREKLLPNVLSKDEIKLILNAHSNLKHKTMLSLIYSCGLRRSELLNLKPGDIDSKRNLILIRMAKGKKDRIVPLSVKILEMLREYYRLFKPDVWLFEGQNGERYSEKSLESVLKQALQKAKIKKPVSLHWLRHSYATHLLESGTDLRFIQEILGHISSKTTEIYTHVSTKSIQNVKSPFDNLDI